MRYHVIIIVSGISLLLFTGLLSPPMGFTTYPDYPDMKMNASPNPVGSGAKAMGMGGAFISVADDATAASWNPGGLIQVLRPEFSIVGSWFSGRYNYNVPELEEGDIGDIDDHSIDTQHLNYLSVVLPMIIFKRNMVFSLSYQHLYEFSQNTMYEYGIITENYTIINKAHKRQTGSLGALSAAYAIQINSSLYIGCTANFWSDNIMDNGWENIDTGRGVTTLSSGKMYVNISEIYEKYSFSGFNMNLGFLYKSDTFSLLGKNKRLRIGGVIKTPFNVEILHEYREKWYQLDPNNPSEVIEPGEWSPPQQTLSLKMPLSYGLGFSLEFSNSFIMAIDLYRTHWDKYLIKYPDGKEISPINRLPEKKASIKSTTQIRLGGQYRYIFNPKSIIINLRTGLFYDPEPAANRPDDFYGVSLGTGITFNNSYSFDIMYQFRFGKKKGLESIMGQDVSARITQHYIYTSLIYYF